MRFLAIGFLLLWTTAAPAQILPPIAVDSPAPVRQIEQTIYIAIGTDGEPGSGTAEDPFNVSSPASPHSIQSVIDALPENSTLMVGPGIYEVGRGISLSDKSITIIGSGMGQTELKLADIGAADSFRYVISNYSYPHSLGKIAISDLTLNANWKGQSVTNNVATLGFTGFGISVHLASIEVKGCGSTRENEAFCVSSNPYVPIVDRQVTFENIFYHSDFGKHVTALHVGGMNGCTVSGVVRGCRIEKDSSGVGIGGSDTKYGITIRDNFVEFSNGASGACYLHDTGNGENVIIEGNDFVIPSYGQGCVIGGAGTMENYTVRNNRFHAAPVAGTGIVINALPGKAVKNLLIVGNQFTRDSAPTLDGKVIVADSGDIDFRAYFNTYDIHAFSTFATGPRIATQFRASANNVSRTVSANIGWPSTTVRWLKGSERDAASGQLGYREQSSSHNRLSPPVAID